MTALKRAMSKFMCEDLCCQSGVSIDAHSVDAFQNAGEKLKVI
jgi:hypothetical protein